RRGRDLTGGATHAMLQRGLEAGGDLAEEGIELELVDPRTPVPFGPEMGRGSGRKTHPPPICPEALGRAGGGGGRARRVTQGAREVMGGGWGGVGGGSGGVRGADGPVPYSQPLEEAVIPGSAEIVAAARALVRGHDGHRRPARASAPTPTTAVPNGHEVSLPR